MDEDYEEDEGLVDLGGDEFEGLIVDVPSGLKFPNIYQGTLNPFGGQGSPQYGGNIPLDCLPPELHHQVPLKTSHLHPEQAPSVYVRSSVKPEVVPMTRLLRAIIADEVRHDEQDARRGAELKLAELIQRLGARNLGPDRLFIGRPLQIELRGLRMGREFMGKTWRGLPDHVAAGYEGKFKLIPTRVWIDIKENE